MENLPQDVDIFYAIKLPLYDLAKLCKTSRKYTNLCNNPYFWKAKIANDFSVNVPVPKDRKEGQDLYESYRIRSMVKKYFWVFLDDLENAIVKGQIKRAWLTRVTKKEREKYLKDLLLDFDPRLQNIRRDGLVEELMKIFAQKGDLYALETLVHYLPLTKKLETLMLENEIAGSSNIGTVNVFIKRNRNRKNPDRLAYYLTSCTKETIDDLLKKGIPADDIFLYTLNTYGICNKDVWPTIFFALGEQNKKITFRDYIFIRSIIDNETKALALGLLENSDAPLLLNFLVRDYPDALFEIKVLLERGVSNSNIYQIALKTKSKNLIDLFNKYKIKQNKSGSSSPRPVSPSGSRSGSPSRSRSPSGSRSRSPSPSHS